MMERGIESHLYRGWCDIQEWLCDGTDSSIYIVFHCLVQ